MSGLIDINFDFRRDTPEGKDPDTFSRTLRTYHKYLWSRPLPNGTLFTLDDTKPGVYLYHQSDLGEFFLSSDSAINSFSKWKRMTHIINLLNRDELEEFRRLGYSMGGMIIFPSNRVDGQHTINMARGVNKLISDRIDLTLECIRRHYNGESSPLAETLALYAGFFSLFGSFQSYVQFFLLQDLVNETFSTVKFFIPFDDFKTPAIPVTLTEYLTYKNKAIIFISARKQRILKV